MSELRGPLDGIVVVDFTTMVAGAGCTRYLADMGAEVIKIESQEGDLMRLVPPFVDGVSLKFGLYNAGKKSIVLDLKDEADLAAVIKLISKADIVVENFRPGVMARLGLAYERVVSVNPGIIYCSISGYGQTGPLAPQPAYAPAVHAFSGFEMMLARMPNLSAPPLDDRIMTGDVLGAINGFGAIMTALVHKLRNGLGSHVDVTLVEGMMHLVGQQDQDAQKSTEYPSAPHPAYKTSDGYISIPLVSPTIFRLCFAVIGRSDWLEDPGMKSFKTIATRKPEIFAAIAQWALERTSAESEAILTKAGVPCGIYNMPHEVLDHPHFRERGTFVNIETGSGGFKVLNSPFKVSSAATDVKPYVASLGGNTADYAIDRSFASKDEKPL